LAAFLTARLGRRQVGRAFEYRIFVATTSSVSPAELAEKLGPIIKDLEAQGRKNMATADMLAAL
jgi:hypothetical protein